MSEIPFRFDEIGYWSELKLEIIEKYGAAYTRAFINQPFLKKYYIDGFSGAGRHLSKETKEEVEGSAVRALRVSPPFDGFYFVDVNPDKTAFLSKLCEGRENTHIYTGDSNDVLTEEVFPKIQFEKYTRALCLLDPYGLHLNWEVLHRAGQSRAIDMFLNFPVMDMNRNAIWKNPEKATAAGIERMTRFWGDDTWRKAAYVENPATKSVWRRRCSQAGQRSDRRRLPRAPLQGGWLRLRAEAAAYEKQQQCCCLLSVFCGQEQDS